MTQDSPKKKETEPSGSPSELLAWSEERFRLLVESAVDYAIFILDPQGHVQTWNLGAERIKGYHADEIIGRHFSCFYEPEAVGRGWPAEMLRRASLQGRAEDEGWRLRKDGSRFFAHVTLTALRTRDGALRGFAKITRDLTEARAHEDANRRLEALEQVSRRTTQFLATLGHELRNPLAPIRSALLVMSMVPGDDPRAIASRGVIERQVARLSHLLDDLLDTGRVMTGRIALDVHPVSLSEVLSRALEITGPAIASRQQQLQVDASEGWAQGDIMRLSQVVQNLLDNASRYTPPGGRLTITSGQQQGEVFLRVVDTGVGISPELLPHVFEPFVQAERSLDRAEGGLGLGLALAQQVALMHGGRIVAESAGLRQGSTFTLWLPAVTPVPLPPEPSPVPAWDARRVLVVDDNRDAADVLKLALELSGHQVEVAYDGPSALALVEKTRPDLVLLDLGLPGMSGYEVVAQLRAGARGADRAGPRVVALTGYGQQEDRRRTTEAGFDGHLVKPVDFDVLAKLLAELTRP